MNPPGFTVNIPDAPGKPQGRMFRSTAPPTTSNGIPPMLETCKTYDSATGACGCPPGQDHQADEQSTLRFLSDMWTKARNGKQTSHQRLTMIEKLYRGRHFEGNDQKLLEVTNFCFSNVETVAGIFNRTRVMPRVEPLGPHDDQKSQVVREVLNWWQNRQRVWMARSSANRSKVKNGCSILMITIDPATGMPFVTDWSLWDTYFDPSAKDVPGLEFIVFAAPIPTRRLREMFVGKCDRIKPDQYTSPEWEVTQLIDAGMYAGQPSRNTAIPSITNTDSTAPYRGTTQPTGGTLLAGSTSSRQNPGSDSTFFLQFLVRDRTKRTWTAPGIVSSPSPIPGDPYAIEHPDTFQYQDLVSPSGWRTYFATQDTLLAEESLDECYGGLPFVVDYYVRHPGRIEGISEIEPMAPLQRSYNEQKNILRRSIRISGTPVLRADKGNGLNLSKRTVEAGDVVEPNKGSLVEWLEFNGPNQAQFNHLGTQKRDIEIVTGVHEALQGIRPEGVETGVAIRELASASATRIQAKQPEALIAWADVLTKVARILRSKLSIPIMFKATNGQFLGVTRNDLAGDFVVKFPADENDLDAGEKIKNEMLTLFQLGLVDRIEVLKRIEYPGYQDVAMRMLKEDMMKAQAEAAAKAQAGPPGGNAKGGGNEASGPPQAA